MASTIAKMDTPRGGGSYCFRIHDITQCATDFIRLIKRIKEDGCPVLVVADRFSAINSKEFKLYLGGENIEILFTPVDHPQSNGMVERVNQTLIGKLRCMMCEYPDKAWTTVALHAIEAYNATIHTVTKFPPEYIMFGRDSNQSYANHTLDQNRRIAKTNSDRNHEQNKLNYDRRIQRNNFDKGEWVLVCRKNRLNRHKLAPIFEGPYMIVDKLSERSFKVDFGGKVEVVHVSKIKKSENSNTTQQDE